MPGVSTWVLAASFVLWLPWNWAHTRGTQRDSPAKVAIAAKPAIDFHKQIKPILAARCQPCHFPGGVMHARLPFDQPDTIQKLGTKLFSRIRDEKDRGLIREFLAQHGAEAKTQKPQKD